jgi:hypothetical protein
MDDDVHKTVDFSLESHGLGSRSKTGGINSTAGVERKAKHNQRGEMAREMRDDKMRVDHATKLIN